MTARLGRTPKDARNIAEMMSGFNFATLCTVLCIYILSNLVESKDSLTQMEKRFTRENICRETIKTAKLVKACPTEEKSIIERTELLNCEGIFESCSTEKFVYHCVPSGKKLIEVCAPRKYLTGKNCVKFDDGAGHVMEDYNVICPECPFHYYSNASIKYPTCQNYMQSMSAAQFITTMMSTEKYVSLTTKKSPQIATKALNNKKSTEACRYLTGRRIRSRICEQNTFSTTERSYIHRQANEKNNVETSQQSSEDVNCLYIFHSTAIMFVLFALCGFATLKVLDAKKAKETLPNP